MGSDLHRQYQFWILAVCVGCFQGAVQSMSRSYYAKIIPAENPENTSEFMIFAEKELLLWEPFWCLQVGQITGSVKSGS